MYIKWFLKNKAKSERKSICSSSEDHLCGMRFHLHVGPPENQIPIGSMYGIYTNIGGILMVNVTIYSIHGSYGIWRAHHWSFSWNRWTDLVPCDGRSSSTFMLQWFQQTSTTQGAPLLPWNLDEQVAGFKVWRFHWQRNKYRYGKWTIWTGKWQFKFAQIWLRLRILGWVDTTNSYKWSICPSIDATCSSHTRQSWKTLAWFLINYY